MQERSSAQSWDLMVQYIKALRVEHRDAIARLERQRTEDSERIGQLQAQLALLRPSGLDLSSRLALSAEEVAKLLGVSLRTVRGDPALPRVRLGRRVVFPIAALQQWLLDRATAGFEPCETGQRRPDRFEVLDTGQAKSHGTQAI